MPPVNRFSQIVQPSVVNPISFEEFARVPMSAAQAQASATAATQSIGTDYDVDMKDLERVQGAVAEIDKGKNEISTSIMNNGVTKQTMSQFMNVKNKRDRVYKDLVNKAQQNNLQIKAWRENVDRMVVAGKIPSWYGETIKAKEYDKWEGTLQDDGNLADFIPTYGERYFDVDKDIQQVMSQAAFTLTGEEIEKIKPRWVEGNLMLTDDKGVLQYDNFRGLQAAVNKIVNDYRTQGTERGDFAAYTEMDQEFLQQKITNYFNIYARQDIKQTGGARRFVRPPASGKTATGTETAPTSFISGVDIKYKMSVPTSSNRFFGTGLEIADQFQKDLESKNFWERGWSMNPISIWSNAIKAYQKGTDIAAAGEYSKKKVLDSHPGAIKYLRDNNIISKNLLDKAVEGNEDAIGDVYDEVKTHMTNLSEGTSQVPVALEDFLNQKFSIKMNKNIKGAGNDLGRNLKSIPVYTADTRTEVGEDVKKEIKEALLKADPTAFIKANMPVGSPFTTDSNGEYIRDLSQGYVIEYDGKEYITGRIWEQNEPKNTALGFRYQSGADLEEYITPIPMGQLVPILYLNDENKLVEAKYGRSDYDGKRQVILPDGTPKDFDEISGKLYSPKTFTQKK